MIVVSSVNSGDRDATPTNFPLDENSKLSPKASRRTSSFEFRSSYTDGLETLAS